MNRLFLANSASPAVFSDPPAEYVRRMHAGNPRKLWYLRPGDALIASTAPSNANVDYALAMQGLDPASRPEFLVPRGDQPSLPERALADAPLMNRLADLCRARKMILVPFVHDAPAHRLAGELKIPIGAFPNGTVMTPQAAKITQEVTYEFNDKEAFKAYCRTLGIPVPAGEACNGNELAKVTLDVLRKAPAVIIKRSRGSNGFGHTIVTRGVDIPEAVAPLVALGGEVRYVVEPYATVRTAPSLEFVITDAGVERYYACDMRCHNNAWVGMMIPALETPPHILEAMWRAGEVFARGVFERGFRGNFDLDGITTQDGSWFFTESNIRATGGTHTYHILSQLLSPEGLRNRVALVDSVRLNGREYGTVVDEARRKGYAFEKRTESGIIFVMDGSVTEGTLRYIVVGKDIGSATEVESWLRASMQTGQWNESDTEFFLQYDRIFNPAQSAAIAAILGTLGRFANRERFRVLELGSGQGWLVKTILETLPNAHCTALDGSRRMLESTRSLCSAHADRLTTDEFRLESDGWRDQGEAYDAIVSSLVVHHLDADGKVRLYGDLLRMLRPGGVLLIYDIVGFRSTEQQRWFSESYERAVVQNARTSLAPADAQVAIDAFHTSHWNFFKYPDDPLDKPSPVAFHLQSLTAAGFEAVDVFFAMAGHALYVGFKP